MPVPSTYFRPYACCAQAELECGAAIEREVQPKQKGRLTLMDVLAPSFLIPTAISIGAAVWTYLTSRRLERFKHELQRDLKAHETTLKVAAEIESRFHENDLVALRECQKGVTQFFVQCEELFWQIAHNADTHADKIKSLRSEVEKTYFWLRPWLALAPPGPHRKTLEDLVRSAFTKADGYYDAWSLARAAGRPFENDLPEDGTTPVDSARGGAISALDAWTQSLRDYQIGLVVKVAGQLDASIASSSIAVAKGKTLKP
jgi:hypothetical protein